MSRTAKAKPKNTVRAGRTRMARARHGAPGEDAARDSRGAGFKAAARYISDGLVDVDSVARDVGMTKATLARMLGLSEETLQRLARMSAPKTQQRLRDMLEILTRVEPWAGGMAQAMGWYRGQSIPALGDHTVEALVRNDQAHVVRAYLDGLAAGGYA
jgi:ribosome-binding protein aMBF1 (putative translation factor)